MCLYSSEALTRRAMEGETLVVTTSGTTKVAAPAKPQAGIICACLQTGDPLQLIDVPQDFQTRYSVGRNPVVTFIEGERGKSVDRLDLLNTNIVPFAKLTLGTQIRVLQRTGKKKSVTNRVTEAVPVPVSAGCALVAVAAAVYNFWR